VIPGIEKSGEFVDHANDLGDLIERGAPPAAARRLHPGVRQRPPRRLWGRHILRPQVHLPDHRRAPHRLQHAAARRQSRPQRGRRSLLEGRDDLELTDFPMLGATCALLDVMGTRPYENAVIPLAVAHYWAAIRLQPPAVSGSSNGGTPRARRRGGAAAAAWARRPSAPPARRRGPWPGPVDFVDGQIPPPGETLVATDPGPFADGIARVRLGQRGVRTEARTARSHGLTVRVIPEDTASPSGSPPPRRASSTSPTARWTTRSASAAASTARRPSPAFAPAPGWRTGASPAVPMYSRW
jgi:hypothetical protein